MVGSKFLRKKNENFQITILENRILTCALSVSSHTANRVLFPATNNAMIFKTDLTPISHKNTINSAFKLYIKTSIKINRYLPVLLHCKIEYKINNVELCSNL